MGSEKALGSRVASIATRPSRHGAVASCGVSERRWASMIRRATSRARSSSVTMQTDLGRTTVSIAARTEKEVAVWEAETEHHGEIRLPDAMTILGLRAFTQKRRKRLPAAFHALVCLYSLLFYVVTVT